ncbi:MAG: M48 family metallopeptidase [Brevinematales bacterium]|nr:M48 family metallopeptidase [Brevinematales bacterium]
MQEYPYHVVRSKRKTISIHILGDGKVEIRCPHSTKDHEITRLLQTHASWIEKKRHEVISRPRFHGSFQEGQQLFYLGESYPIILDTTPSIRWDGTAFFLPKKKKKETQDLMEQWYRQQAHLLLTERVAYYAKRYGFSYTGVRISSATKRYGSCSPQNHLSFTWKLVLLPLDLIDYVVVHELVHTREKHHQKDFWKNVAFIMPDYKEREKKLKAMPFSIYWF